MSAHYISLRCLPMAKQSRLAFAPERIKYFAVPDDVANGPLVTNQLAPSGLNRAILNLQFTSDSLRFLYEQRDGRQKSTIVTSYNHSNTKDLPYLQQGITDVDQLAISPNGDFAAAASSSSIRLIELVSGNELDQIIFIKGGRTTVDALTFAADGKSLFYVMRTTANPNVLLMARDLEKKTNLVLWNSPTPITTIAADGSGRYLAVGTPQGTDIWDLKKSRHALSLARQQDRRGGRTLSLSFSADGSRLAELTLGQLRVWDLAKAATVDAFRPLELPPTLPKEIVPTTPMPVPTPKPNSTVPTPVSNDEIQYKTKIQSNVSVLVAPEHNLLLAFQFLGSTRTTGLVCYEYDTFIKCGEFVIPGSSHLFLASPKGDRFYAFAVYTLPVPPNAPPDARPDYRCELQAFDFAAIKGLLKEKVPAAPKELQPTRVITMDGFIEDLTASLDGKWLYYLENTKGSKKLCRLDAATLDKLEKLDMISALRLRQSKAGLYVGIVGVIGRFNVCKIDIDTWKIQKTIVLKTDFPVNILVDDQGNILATINTRKDHRALIFDGSTGEQIGPPILEENSPKINYLSPDRKRLYSVDHHKAPTNISILQIPDGNFQNIKASESRSFSYNKLLGGAVITPDNKYLICSSGDVFQLKVP